ncbi:hypothetical protein [Formosa haliotis]|uniref:hypothetical protein n=1 Tax=Formosa haliotis TaxID=1555194 RepID=UPI0008241574|nr:hypothetical protein [Formosa haliotis]
MDINNDKSVTKAKELANRFADQEGRRPRLLLSKLRHHNDELELKRKASAYADIGFDVDLAPRFQSAKAIAKQAVENDVHVLYLSAIQKDDIILISEIITALLNFNCGHILVVVDSQQLSEADVKKLSNSGVAICLNSEIKINDAAIQILNILIA